MWVVFFFSTVCVLFTYLESVGRMRRGMQWGFVFVTILGCIHYNYGSDYMSYYEAYKTIVSTPFDFKLIFSGDGPYKDPGWSIINYIFMPFGGFFMLVAVLNIIQNVCVYIFIKENVKKEWWWISVFLYLFTYTLYPMNFSMMRQGFVVCVFLGIWPLIREKKIWLTLPLIYILSSIHQSALFLLPFAFWGYLKFRRLKLTGAIFIVLTLLLWLSKDFLDAAFGYFMGIGEVENYVDIYENSISSGNKGFGFIIYQIPVFVSILYYFIAKDTSWIERSIVSLAMIGTMVMPFNGIIQLAGRMGIYFNIYKLFAIPCVFYTIKNQTLRYILLSLYILITLVDYYRFFMGEGWVETYGTFHTIFEVL